jgi:hypothetical protein
MSRILAKGEVEHKIRLDYILPANWEEANNKFGGGYVTITEVAKVAVDRYIANVMAMQMAIKAIRAKESTK